MAWNRILFKNENIFSSCNLNIKIFSSISIFIERGKLLDEEKSEKDISIVSRSSAWNNRHLHKDSILREICCKIKFKNFIIICSGIFLGKSWISNFTIKVSPPVRILQSVEIVSQNSPYLSSIVCDKLLKFVT